MTNKVEGKITIFYSPQYNISFWGIEKLHPFDSQKYKSVYKGLMDSTPLEDQDFIRPFALDQEIIQGSHSKRYLGSLSYPWALTKILEIPLTLLFPWPTVHYKVLYPMLLASGGTVQATFGPRKKAGPSI